MRPVSPLYSPVSHSNCPAWYQLSAMLETMRTSLKRAFGRRSSVRGTRRLTSFAAMGTTLGHAAVLATVEPLTTVPVPAHAQSCATTHVAPAVPGGAGATGTLSPRYCSRFLPIVPMQL